MKRVVIPIFYLLITTALLIACGQSGNKKIEKESPKVAKTFKMTEIPVMITSPEDRINFLTEHYWDHFDFKDTSLIREANVTEQGFADFINIIGNFPVLQAEKAILHHLRQASVDSTMFFHFVSLYDKYIDNPNSPYRNETLYIPVLKFIVNAPTIDSLKKIRPYEKLTLALKNRPGTIANNFKYKLVSGKEQQLSTTDAPFLLLFFYNPGCQNCKEIQDILTNAPAIKQMGNRLKILAIYPDEDIEAWQNYQNNIPKGWINAYNPQQTISKTVSYNLRAIPTLYLLDRDKRVILKDPTITNLIDHLSTL